MKGERKRERKGKISFFHEQQGKQRNENDKDGLHQRFFVCTFASRSRSHGHGGEQSAALATIPFSSFSISRVLSSFFSSLLSSSTYPCLSTFTFSNSKHIRRPCASFKITIKYPRTKVHFHLNPPQTPKAKQTCPPSIKVSAPQSPPCPRARAPSAP